MAKLNLTYYTEKDFYSDGDVEDDILELAKQKRKLSEIPLEECSYPVVYHLSKERENIVAWYPFREHASLLEIGAGCGAITGELCNRVEKVTAVDLSKRRATINYTRHEDRDNLEIYVGNLNDMKFEEKYDYVVLNGVFEYAMSFTEGETPYETFLNYIATFLKPDGIVLIAIENRLGLKYFAGAPEDHTEKCFVGLNGYENNTSVRTFSKKELTAVLDRCGFEHKKFYYPYPDYKFPNEIFTDESLQTQAYGKEYLDFNCNRVELFHEPLVAASLAHENVADVFANSFFVEASRQQIVRSEEVVYAKMNRDRAEEFQIMTTIIENKEGRKVYKSPLSEEAKQHIAKLHETEEKAGNAKYEYLTGTETKRGLCYEFLNSNTVEALIKKALQKRDAEEIKAQLSKVYDTFLAGNSSVCQYRTEAFQKVFGTEPFTEELSCVAPANIDLICDNLFWNGEKYQVIDCEWVFDFPIPAAFIMWRNLNELYYKYPALQALVDRDALQEKFGITKEASEVFYEWNKYYTMKYVKVKQLFQYAREKVKISLDDVCTRALAERENVIRPILYLDLGEGFSEHETMRATSFLEEQAFEVEYSLEEKENVQALRWDPIENKPCRCYVELEVNGEWKRLTPDNAETVTEECDTFYDLDPRYSIPVEAAGDTLHLRGKISFFSMEEAMRGLLQEREERRREMEAARVRIEQDARRRIEEHARSWAEERVKKVWRKGRRQKDGE